MADKNYFRLTSLEDGNELGIANSVDDITQITLEYSTDDGSTWNTYTVGDIVRLDINGFVLFRGDNTTFSKSSSDYHHVFASKRINASGNIMSLLDKSCELVDLTGKNNVFDSLFLNLTTIYDASELMLPATTLADQCYRSMFKGCTSLTQSPALPAETLATSCYSIMFKGCTSLVVATKLPATTLATRCYDAMFQNCTSLTTAPALPATTLVDSCYYSMFNGCTSLTSAPALPATTLAASCYYEMFLKCSNLRRIEVQFKEWNPSNATTNWVLEVPSTGTFICPSELPETRGKSKIPSGWTIEHPKTSGFKNFSINGQSVKTLFINGKEINIKEY